MDPCTWFPRTWFPRTWFSQTVRADSDVTPVLSRFKQLNDHIYEFYKPIGEPDMEIIFFHGIHIGNSDNAYWSTWTGGDASPQDLVWPSTWLAEKFPRAHILSISYNIGPPLDHYVFAENLLYSIVEAQIGQGPVILVGHSFGGLVIKQLCVNAHSILSRGTDSTKSREIGKFLNKVGGVFFYGTPHHGSRFTDILRFFLNGPLLDYASELSMQSARLTYAFDSLANKYKWGSAGVGEALPTSRGPFVGVVVPEGSARSGSIFQIVEPADHISLCKPKRKTSRNFLALIDFISIVAPKVQGEDPFDNFQILPEAAIGLDQRVKEITEIMQENTRIGIFGMGGSGKTVLAQAVFNKLCPVFEYSCFVPEVRGIQRSAQDLKGKVWSYMYHRGKQVLDKEDGWSELRGKRVLLVFDDVNDDSNLKFLLDILHDLDTGSRCIVTSRRQILHYHLDHNYDMQLLNVEDARQLFIRYAFPDQRVLPTLLDHVYKIVEKTDGLPLPIAILGNYLKGVENVSVWEQAWQTLDEAHHVANDSQDRLWKTLKVIYDGLGEKEQQIFLDATTFFNYDNYYMYDSWTLREAKAAWRVTYEMVELRWKRLVDMSLVSDVDDDQPIKVHKQLQSLGRKIALELNKDAKCRVWDVDEQNRMASELLDSTNDHDFDDQDRPQNNMVKFSRSCIGKLYKVQYLDLQVPDIVIDHRANPLERLVLLRSPRLQFGRRLLFDPALLPRLAVLKLHGHNVKSLPSSFDKLSGLKILEIANAPELETLPDEFGLLSQLERLTFTQCSSLLKLPITFGCLRNLQHLEFYLADQLQALPDSFGQLSALKHLKFHHCEKLLTLPKSFGRLSTLEHLEFHGCGSLHVLPLSPGHLVALRQLVIVNVGLTSIPHCIKALPSLKILELGILRFLEEFPSGLGTREALAESRNIFHVQDGQFSFQSENNLTKSGTLRDLLHGIAHGRARALDYAGAAEILGLDLQNPGREPTRVWGVILLERARIKRSIGDMDGAFEDFADALLELNSTHSSLDHSEMYSD